jgi:outer membrane protein TolC
VCPGNRYPLAQLAAMEKADPPVLDRLVDQALVSNLDLHLAQARIREARSQLVVSKAAAAPDISIFGSAMQSRNRTNQLQRIAAMDFGSPGAVIDLFQAGFDAEWEICEFVT